MRIIVISDTHGSFHALESVFLRNSDADWFIHLGDGERDLDGFLAENPQFTPKVVHVCGNCDPCSLSPGFFILPVGGHRIYATHGHTFGVKSSIEILKRTARENGCDIVLYGHTHIRFNGYDDGLYILNPGSAGCPHDGNAPSFGHIDISDAGVVINIAEI